MLDKLIERGKTMAVLFYDPSDHQDLDIMDELEKIDDECRRFEIDFVKVIQSIINYSSLITLLIFGNVSLTEAEINEFISIIRLVMPLKQKSMESMNFPVYYILKIRYLPCMTENFKMKMSY